MKYPFLPRVSFFLFTVICLSLFSVISCGDDTEPEIATSKVIDQPWAGDLASIPRAMQEKNPLVSDSAEKGGRFVIYSHQFPKSLNYYLDQFTTTARIFTSLYETLAIYHPETLEPIPNLARSWKISPDKKKFTFYLDPNASWSDGKPVTADDVLFTFDTIMDKNNLTAFFRIALSRFKRPKVIDNRTIEFEVSDSHWNNFNEIASSLWILPKHHFEGRDFNKENFEFPIVSGPYKIVESKKNRYIKLERRGDWWKRAYPFHSGMYNFDQLVYKVYTEESIAFQAFKKGDIDFFPVYTASLWVEEAKGDIFDRNLVGKTRFYNQKPIGFQGWAMNMRRPIFSDVRVRKAISHLVNRSLMIEKLAYNEYKQTDSYFPDLYLLDAENPNTPIDYNPKEARELLQQAGWVPNPKGILEKDGKEFRFTILDRDRKTEKYFTIFLEQAKYLGIDAKIETTDLAAWSARVDKYDFDMTWAAWGSGIFKDPEAQWYSKYADEDGQPNLTGLKLPSVDRLIEAQKNEFDVNRRHNIVKKIDQLIYKEHPYVLLWHLDNTRILYWNKFGMPEAPLGRYGSEDFATDYWYFDSKKNSQLKECISKRTTCPTIPMEYRWNP
jgi:microcin C transport system substrate-binding protein